MHARIAQIPTPTSEIEFGFPFSAIPASNSYDFDAVSITFSGISAAYFVADSTAAARDAFSSADCFGNANASITLLKAAVSSSTSASNSSLSCCAFTAHLLKYSSLSSQPRLPAERFATIPPSETPNAPINAATDPPPGAGESPNVSSQNSRRFMFNNDFLESDSILNSITFSFGSKGFSSLNPIDRTAMSISSSLEAPSEHFCLRRKYLPASTRLFFGTMPTISDPVTRRPRLLADSTQASNATCKGVCSMFVRFMETCAIPYSSTYQPMAFTCFNIPGMRIGSPLASSTGFPDGVPSSVLIRPFSLTSNATEFALLTAFVFKFTLYATKKSRAPITVAPDFSLKMEGPKSGFHAGSFIFSKKPSYSPARITERFERALSLAALS